jgi:hypothetical protein
MPKYLYSSPPIEDEEPRRFRDLFRCKAISPMFGFRCVYRRFHRTYWMHFYSNADGFTHGWHTPPGEKSDGS